MGMSYGLDDRSARHRFDQHCCSSSLYLPRGKCRCFAMPSDPSGMALDLLMDGGAAANPPVYDDSLGFFASAHAELLGWPSLTADLAPYCESDEGKVTAYPPSQAPLKSRCPYGCGDPPKISVRRRSILGVLLIPGMSHERLISSALRLQQCRKE